MKPSAKPRDRIGKLLAVVLVCFGAAIVVFGLRYHAAQKQEIEQAARDTLDAVADLKVEQILEWRSEMLGDANWVFHGSTIGNDVGKLSAGQTDDAALYRRTLWLVTWKQYQQYNRVLLLDKTGKVLLAAPAEKKELGQRAQGFIARTVVENEVLVLDLHQSTSTPGTVNMDVFVPLIERLNADSVGRIVGVLMLEIDPNKFLYPMIEAWPTPSKTAETLLVRRDGDEVVYLNELRHRKGTALKLKVAITDRQIPAVRAVLGEEGIVDGLDYRGVPVLAALRKIPDSPWFIVAKQDQVEILAPLRRQAWTAGTAVGGLILAVLLGLALLWRRRERLFTTQELAERKQAEAILRESEDKFKFFFEHSNVGQSITELSGKLRVNQAFSNLLGYTREELQHLSWQAITPPEDIEPTQQILDVVLSGKQDSARFTKRYLTKNGSVIWVDVSTALRRDSTGRPLYFMTALLDITDRKKAEEILRQTQQQLELALKSAEAGTWDWDLITGKPIWSQELFAMLGFDPKCDEPSFELWENSVHPDDRPIAAQRLQQALESGNLLHSEFRVIHPNGQTRWIYVVGKITYDSNRKPIRMGGVCFDFTDRIKKENDLRRSEFRLKESQRLARLGNWELDLTSNKQTWSDEIFRIFEIDPTLFGASYDAFLAAIHPDDRDTVNRAYAESIRNRQPYEITHRLLMPDGRIKFVQVQCETSFNPAGKPLFSVGTVQDVTEQKCTEQALRDSEQRYANTLTAVNDGLWNWHVPSGTAYFSPLYYTMLGYADQAFIANYTNWRALIHPDDLARVEQDLRQSLESGQGFAIDLRMKTKSGDWRWCSTRGNTIERTSDGQVLRMAGTLSDITQRKEAEEGLEQFFALVPDMVCIASADGYFLSLNDAWERVLGYSKAELMAVPFAEFVHPDDRNATLKESARQRTGKAAYNFANRYRAKNGAYHWFEWNATAANEKGMVFAAARDITEHKQANETLRETQALYNSFIEQLPNAVFRKDREGRYLLVNSQFCRLNKLKREEIIGRTPAEIAVQEKPRQGNQGHATKYANEGKDTHEKILETGKTYEAEEEYPNDDGTKLFMHVVRMPVLDTSGNIIGTQGILFDITARKLAEDALRESEFTLRESQAIAGLGTYVTDISNNTWQSSAVLDQLLGLKPAPVRPVEEWVGCVHPEDRAMMDAYFVDHVVGQRQSFNKEYRIARQDDQTTRWVHGLGRLTFDAEGRPIEMRGTIQDITERKLAQEALRTSENRFRGLFDLAVDGIVIGTPNGVCTEMNQQFCVLVGRTREELLGKKIEVLFAPEVLREKPPRWDLLNQGEPLKTVRPIKRPDGLEIIVEMHSKLMPDGSYQAFFHDVTAQVQAEAALRESEDRFSKVFRDAPVWIAITDLATNAYVDVNEETLRVSGFTRKEVIGHTMAELGWVAIEHRTRLGREIQEHGRVAGMEIPIHVRDGRMMYGWIKGEKITLGGRTCLLTVTVETTERKRAEEALLTQTKLHAAELEQRVHERTAELEATNKELEAFSYSVSHDLRAPLRAIDGFSNILNTDFMSRLDKEGQRILGIICAEARRMGLLIDDLLTFSRMNRLPLQNGEIDMSSLAQTVFDECTASVPGRQLQIKLQPLPNAQGDQPMIRQVLINLIANAIKYTRPKPLAEIEIGGHREGGENFYYLKDNGVGFDQRYADKLFGVFQRLHTEDEFEGTGVGLALVQRVIHRHGGRVWAEAKINEGATFYFTLPSKANL